MLPRNVLIALLCCLLAMQNLIVASQQLLLVLLGRIRLLRLMETLSQLLNKCRRRCRFHPYWTFPRPVESWFDIHTHQRNFPEAFFRRHLRMGRDSFDNLLTLLRGYVQREITLDFEIAYRQRRSWPLDYIGQHMVALTIIQPLQ